VRSRVAVRHAHGSQDTRRVLTRGVRFSARRLAACPMGLKAGRAYPHPMFAANTYKIRPAPEPEGVALRGLRGPILVGEVDGRPAAALSVPDGRSVTNPFSPN